MAVSIAASGYSLCDSAEQWLVDNPATPDEENSFHYRFCIFNLENLTVTQNGPIGTLIMTGGVVAAVVVVAVDVSWMRNQRPTSR